jgi:antitoxin VapB
MAISLKDPETDRLARAVAAMTGETLTNAIRTALAERLEREKRRRGEPGDLATRFREIGEHRIMIRELRTRLSATTKPACGVDGRRHLGAGFDLMA